VSMFAQLSTPAGWTRTSGAACYNFLYCIKAIPLFEPTWLCDCSLAASKGGPIRRLASGRQVGTQHEREPGHQAMGTPVVLEDQLKAATHSWTSRSVARTYRSDKGGQALMGAEVTILGNHGYTPSTSSTDGGHINVGRTLMGAELTDGWSLLFGGSRTGGSIVVTYTRAASTTVAGRISDLVGECEATGYRSMYRGATFIKVKDVSHGLRGSTLSSSGTVTNISEEPVEDAEIEVVVATHNQALPTFKLSSIGGGNALGGLGVVIPSHFGAKITTFEFRTGPIGPKQEVPYRWDWSGKAARLAWIHLPKRICRAGAWSDPNPVSLSATAEGNLAIQEANQTAKEHEGMKVCPDCAEWVRQEARICRFCRHDFEPTS